MGTGTGWNRHRGGSVTARNPEESRPWGRPGEVFGEDCSQADPERGRRVGRRHKGGKPVGTGPDRAARTGSNGRDTYWARHRPGAPPPPGGRGSRPETGNGVPGSTGWSGAVGHRNGGTVGLSPDGGSWSSQVRSAGRRVGGTGSERNPSGHRSQGRSPERVAGQVAVGRRSGSEELTGSPEGYLGPFPRFPPLPPGTQRPATPATAPYRGQSSWHVGPGPSGRRQDHHHRTRDHWNQLSETPIAGQGGDAQHYWDSVENVTLEAV